MKKAKAQPSVAGLLLIVAGMLLFSILLLHLASARNATANGTFLMVMGVAAVGSVVVGVILTSRKDKAAPKGKTLRHHS